jgi:hypothetical protein
LHGFKKRTVEMTGALEAWELAFGTLPVSEGIRLRDATEVRFFPGTDRARFQNLYAIGDLDAFLASDCARAPRVGVADSRRAGSAIVPYNDYTTDDGQVDLPRLLGLYDAGATLVLSQMHQIHLPLIHFCQGLERIFLHPVQCNIYLTPPRAQGFRIHGDTHDVLILQVQGEKLWRFWPTPPVPLVDNSMPPDKQPSLDEEPRTQMLRPGDVFYLPRATLHDAVSHDAQSSLHLTVGLLGQSWGEALHAVLNVMDPQDLLQAVGM